MENNTRYTGKENTKEANKIREQVLEELDKTNEYFIKSKDIEYESLEWRVKCRLLNILQDLDLLKRQYNGRLQQHEWWVYKQNPDSSLINVSSLYACVPKDILESVNKQADKELFGGIDANGELIQSVGGTNKGDSLNEDDSKYEEYFDNLLRSVVNELDENEEMTLFLDDAYEDEDWVEKMNILTQLTNDGRISIDFCAEHMAFHFEIGDRISCEHHSQEAKQLEKEFLEEDEILSSSEIN